MTDSKKCPKCGSPLKPNARFCIICGNKIEEIPEKQKDEDKDICLSCGSKLKPNARFCTICGAKVNIIPEVPVEAEEKPIEVPPIEAEPAPQPVTNSCPSCGATLKQRARFCVICGTKLDIAPVDVPVEATVNVVVDEPANETVYAAVDEPINETIDEPVDETVYVAVDEQVNEPVDESVDETVETPAETGAETEFETVVAPVAEEPADTEPEFEPEPIAETETITEAEPIAEAEPSQSDSSPANYNDFADNYNSDDNFLCPCCGILLEKGATVCIICGTKLSASSNETATDVSLDISEPDTAPRCPICNEILEEPDAKFCTSCGAKLIVENQCPSCGRPHRPGLKFCSNCGEKLI